MVFGVGVSVFAFAEAAGLLITSFALQHCLPTQGEEDAMGGRERRHVLEGGWGVAVSTPFSFSLV